MRPAGSHAVKRPVMSLSLSLSLRLGIAAPRVGFATTSRMEAPSLHASPRSVRLMRILIAEDETIIRLDLRQLLERAGYDVVAEAKDGEEAVALARSAA